MIFFLPHDSEPGEGKDSAFTPISSMLADPTEGSTSR